MRGLKSSVYKSVCGCVGFSGVFLLTRNSYSSSTSRSSRHLRRWWGCFPFWCALGGHWQLLLDEPASVSYASPPALSPWAESRRLQWESCAESRVVVMVVGEVSLEDHYRIKRKHHTQNSPRNRKRLEIWQPARSSKEDWEEEKKRLKPKWYGNLVLKSVLAKLKLPEVNKRVLRNARTLHDQLLHNATAIDMKYINIWMQTAREASGFF